MKSKIALYPFLLSAFPVLFMWGHNATEGVSAREALVVLGMVLGATACIQALLARAVGDPHKAAILVSLSLLLFFSYGHFARLVWSVKMGIGSIEIGRNWILSCLWVGTWSFGVWRIFGSRADFSKAVPMLNVVAALLILTPLLRIGLASLPNVASGTHSWNEDQQNARGKLGGIPPDIYYIVMDRYARKDVFQRAYGFDNAPFVGFLKTKGFYVAERSYANYARTRQSLASCLNMTYLDTLMTADAGKGEVEKKLASLLDDHLLGRFLKSRGYEYIHLGSYYWPTAKSRNADKTPRYCWIPFGFLALSEFSARLYETTMLYPVGLKLGFDFRLEQYNRVLFKFARLSEIPANPRPTFTFAHFLCPHDPYVFDSTGRFVSKDSASRRTQSRNYINQVLFVNNALRELIDVLTRGSGRHPLIVLQSDEGPFPEGVDPYTFNWKNADPCQINEKTAILNAYLLPKADHEFLYPEISPVNTFRFILKRHFGEEYSLLPDKGYVVESEENPGTFWDVTDNLVCANDAPLP